MAKHDYPNNYQERAITGDNTRVGKTKRLQLFRSIYGDYSQEEWDRSKKLRPELWRYHSVLTKNMKVIRERERQKALRQARMILHLEQAGVSGKFAEFGVVDCFDMGNDAYGESTWDDCVPIYGCGGVISGRAVHRLCDLDTPETVISSTVQIDTITSVDGQATFDFATGELRVEWLEEEEQETKMDMNVHTVEVCFQHDLRPELGWNHNPRKRYSYLTDRDLNEGDIVVVDSPTTQFTCVKVVAVHRNVRRLTASKWVVDVVDASRYHETIAREARRKDLEKRLNAMAEAYRHTIKYEDVARYSPEAAELLREYKTLL